MRTELPDSAEIEAAIVQVLKAERDAEGELARCKAECAEEIARARREAEAIAARTERRIAALSAGMAEAVERQIAELDASAPAAAPPGVGDDLAGLGRAAEALARELIGA